MKNYLNLTISYKGQKQDLSLPAKMEVRRLLKELDTIFNWDHPSFKRQVFIENKGILLDEGDKLNQLGISSGDILVIGEREEAE